MEEPKYCWKCRKELPVENLHYDYDKDGNEVLVCYNCLMNDDGSDKEGAY